MFLGMTPKAQATKAKTNRTTEAINRMKRLCTEWKNIFAKHICDKELAYKIYKELIRLDSKKQTAQLKNGQRA